MPGNITGAQNSAYSGMKLAEEQLQVISGNVANVKTPGYTKKVLTYTTNNTNGINTGVQSSELIRMVDQEKYNQVIKISNIHNKLSTLAKFYQNVDIAMGDVNSGASLDGFISKFNSTLSALVNRPEVSSVRNEVIDSAKQMAVEVRTFANTIQTNRQIADNSITESIQIINQNINNLQQINSNIASANALDGSVADFLDQRDQILRNLSDQMDIRVQHNSDKTVSIFTSNNQPLLTLAASQLTFNQSTSITAGITYIGGGLGGVFVNGQDITTSIVGGRIGGLLQMRDTILPNIQAELDLFTSTLRDNVNAIHNAGTSITPMNQLTSSRTFAAATAAFAGTGIARFSVVGPNGNFVANLDLDLSTVTTINALMGALNAGLAGSATAPFANGQLSITANSANNGIAITSIGPSAIENTTGLGVSQFFGFNDFFVTPGTLNGPGVGLANIIDVKSGLTSSQLATARLNNTSPLPGILNSNVAINSGDNSNAAALNAILDSKISFAAIGNLNAITESLPQYIRSIIQSNASMSASNQKNLETKSANLRLTENAFDQLSGVNLQEELTNTMKWQEYQKSCAEVARAANQMIDNIIDLVRG